LLPMARVCAWALTVASAAAVERAAIERVLYVFIVLPPVKSVF
jgi:hypothetical protein